MPKKLIHFYLMQDYDTVILQVTALHEHPGLSTKGFLLKGKIDLQMSGQLLHNAQKQHNQIPYCLWHP